jgi:chemotaxis protein MotB
MDGQRPIIIVKKKAGHAGHHGGAWKVAYADFVTAMMALFIVLWLLNTSKPVREAIAGYFKDPSGTGKELGTTKPGKGQQVTLTTVTKDNIAELKEKLEKAIRKMTNFDQLKNQITLTVTPEGLRIDLLETASGTFFSLGSPTPNANGKELLIRVANELGKVPNKITIEGHTDAKPYSGNGDYSNWELSADRANAARRIMQENGLGADQVSQVRGYADQQLRDPKNPFDPSNRRISVIVHYLEQQDEQPASASGVAPEETRPASSAPAQTKPSAVPGKKQ